MAERGAPTADGLAAALNTYAALVSLFSERTDVVSVLDDLAENERKVRRRRFGLEGGELQTLAAIDRELGSRANLI